MVAHEWLHMNRSACAGFHVQPANPHAQPACAIHMRNPGKSGPAVVMMMVVIMVVVMMVMVMMVVMM
eukprot:10589861-Lingulodinium_polyedra.AAC.1